MKSNIPQNKYVHQSRKQKETIKNKLNFNTDTLEVFMDMIAIHPECDIEYLENNAKKQVTGIVKEVNLESKIPFVIFKDIPDFKLPLALITSINNIKLTLFK